MSVEDLKKYGKMCVEDEGLKSKAEEIGLDVEGHIAQGKELGLEFGVEDFQALAEEVGFTKDELTEEQLEKVAGGAIATTLFVGGLVLGAIVGGGLAATTAGAGVGLALVALEARRW